MTLMLAVWMALARLGGPGPDPVAQAERVVRDLDAGRFEAARASFSATVKSALPEMQLRMVMDQVHAQSGKLLRRLDAGVDQKGGLQVVRLTMRYERTPPDWLFTVSLNPRGEVEGIWVKPAPPKGPVSEVELRAALDALPAQASVYATVAERPEVAFRHHADRAANLGSLFKVFLLARASELLAAGKISPSQRLRLDGSVRSLPSGLLQELDDGVQPTVNDVLKLMIAISDNTATDMVGRLLGWREVEKRLPGWGIKTPLILFSTRQLFALAYGRVPSLPPEPDARFALLRVMTPALLRAAAVKAEAELFAQPIDVAALDAELKGSEGFEARKRVSHLLDWKATPEEMGGLLRAAATRALGGSPKVGERFEHYLRAGGKIDSIIGRALKGDPRVKWVARKGGGDVGILTDAGYLLTDRGEHIVIVFLTNEHKSPGAEALLIEQMGALSAQIFERLYAAAPAHAP
ncbi:MAG TPA: serine hydrolase [Polyangia bacterium]|nr:serine hydrolase [Polyangia bacterium]